MPTIDLVDDTFIAAAPERVADIVHDAECWRRWWPDLSVTTARDRGAKGRQWVAQGRNGATSLVGTVEIWLEPWGDGVIVHHYQRLDPVGAERSSRWVERQRRRRAVAWKRHVHLLKDRLEHSRVLGQNVQDVHPFGRSSQ